MAVDCGFRVALPPLGSVCFVDRGLEFERLWGLLGRGAGVPLLVYGPEGCGKSTLLRYLAWRASRDGAVAVYIDALSGGDPEEAVYPLTAALREIVDEVAGAAGGAAGRVLAGRIGALVARIVERLEASGRRVLLVVDDVYQAIGVEEASAYTKRLYELIHRLYEAGAGSVLVVAATSEGVSRRILARHSYVLPQMLWNLGRSGLQELVSQVDAPLPPETLWRLTGGNPRALSQLATLGWDVDSWLGLLAVERIRPLLDSIGRERLKRLVEDPDSDPEAASILEEHNLMIRLSREASLGEAPEPDTELGIGRDWAWQLPALRLAAEKLLTRTKGREGL
ncbi:hypothetical protein PABY_17820 [Pyrodictium abyssi]|uniref:AAA+ ATPase domain-containing protein n=1 Tax=Pyrodictium abyssi TaxID=54256 RepID=A0ABM8J0D3_9CREN|nr:hypothetical protein PABY_17820 [Pyrodictium abyssi]